MLEWLGHEATLQGAARIRRAVEAVLADPARRTPDLGGTMTTRQMGEAILANL
jgi:3-isopropylmalate dehydrogenase